MTSDTLSQKCDDCGLYLEFSNFYRNKSKSSGYHNRCKLCMNEYKMQLKKDRELPPPILIKRELYFVPNIYIVGYGRSQTYQNCCLKCESAFFCLKEIREDEDLFCDDCLDYDKMCIPEKNISPNNFIGHVVGWLSKVESPSRRRNQRNYKKAYQRDKYTCQYCGYNLELSKEFRPLHIDHIKPWSAQGGNSLDNLSVACQECNNIALDKWFTSFQEKKDYILWERRKKKIE